MDSNACRSAFLGFAFLSFFSAAASANIISLQRDYNQYGHLSNEGDSCACTSAVNSMLYLMNTHPGVADTLITDVDGNAVITDVDLHFARDELRDGWTNSSGVARTGMGAPAGRKDIWEQQIYWTEDMAPTVRFIFSGMTGFAVDDPSTWYRGGSLVKGMPTFDYMWEQLAAGEDVELGIYGATIAHAIVLTSLKFDDLDADSMWDSASEMGWVDYLDPNNPSQLFERQMWANGDGSLGFNWFNNGANTPEDVYIGRAYSKSIPEPETYALFALGLLALVYTRRRRLLS